MNLNKVVLIGRLTHDPEMRSTTSGQNVTTLNIATNRVWNDKTGQRQESTEYHRVIAWARLGEIANQYLNRGALIMIEGRLQTRSWTDQNNTKRYMTEIIAENLQMGPRAQGASSQQSGQSQGYNRQATPASTQNISQGQVKNNTSSSYQSGSRQDTSTDSTPSTSSVQASSVQDTDIPIIDENEPTTQGVDEEEVSIKEKDLPF
jgi:single-strand DNA-binding protein